MPIVVAWLGQAWGSEHQRSLLNVVGDAWMAGAMPKALPDKVELLMVLAGVLTSGSS